MKVSRSSFRKFELPIVAEMVRDSLLRDRAAFEDFAPDFKDSFLKNFDKKISEVQELEKPIQITGELKKATARLKDNVQELRKALNCVEIYAKKANGSMNMDYRDFGFSMVRAKMAKSDVEGVIGGLNVLKANLEKNNQSLESLGFTKQKVKQFESLSAEIHKDNLLQNKILSDRQNAVVELNQKLAELWDLVKYILDIGRALYKFDDPVRAKDYTASRIRARIRAERKRVSDDDLQIEDQQEVVEHEANSVREKPGEIAA